jgi:hypothetical protein
MWFTPPDIGVTVMVIFVDGKRSDGYYIGCIPSRFGNSMIPAIGGTTVADPSPDEKKRYSTKQPLPTAEVNRRANDLDKSTAVDKIKRAVHPIADRFLEQGLIEDDVRGVSTSTVRRDIPNMVFGILSPGPLDKRDGAKKSFIGRKDSKTKTPVAVSRLGGTQFIMDDGDDRYQRKTHASKGPVKYADILEGEKGDANIPYNEYFRVRTRTGHQILLHNSEDLIYIGNARGTSWIEMTSNGKIDIYAEDSVSIHTGTDLNIRADRDINLEAGRNINMRAATGKFHVDVATNLELVIGANGLITTKGNLDINTTGNNAITSTGALDIKSGAASKWTSAGDASIGAANLILKGGKIDLNGPAAPAAADAAIAEALTLNKNILTDGSKSWASTKYQAGTLESIMKRIPMHEPWALHEHFAPDQLTPDNTDRDS